MNTISNADLQIIDIRLVYEIIDEWMNEWMSELYAVKTEIPLIRYQSISQKWKLGSLNRAQILRVCCKAAVKFQIELCIHYSIVGLLCAFCVDAKFVVALISGTGVPSSRRYFWRFYRLAPMHVRRVQFVIFHIGSFRSL